MVGLGCRLGRVPGTVTISVRSRLRKRSALRCCEARKVLAFVFGSGRITLQAEVFEETATMDFPFEGIPTVPPRKDMTHMVRTIEWSYIR